MCNHRHVTDVGRFCLKGAYLVYGVLSVLQTLLSSTRLTDSKIARREEIGKLKYVLKTNKTYTMAAGEFQVQIGRRSS